MSIQSLADLVRLVLPLTAIYLSFGFVPIRAQDNASSVTLDLASGSVLLYPGTSQSLGLSVSGGTLLPVYVIVSGLPTGISVSPSPLMLYPRSSGTLTFTAALNAAASGFPGQDSTLSAITSQVNIKATNGITSVEQGLNISLSLSNSGFTPKQGATDVPVLQINTAGNAPVLSKDDYITGTLTIVPASTAQKYSYNGGISIKGHGSTTWTMPKKPYKIKLGSKASLLGLPSAKDWILLANWDDKTMLRDYVAFEIGNRVGFPWSPRSAFVELYLNGQYEGAYQLTEEVEINSNRINITEMLQSDTSGSALTGGYLLEIDQHRDEDFVFFTPEGLPIGLKDPDFTPEVSQQTSYIQSYVTAAENALFSSTATNPSTGWRAFFDETSLIRFYLVNEIMGNNDGGGFWSSDYLYKQRNNPLLYMGPVWDFDISSGNQNYNAIEDPTVWWTRVANPWYPQLFQDPEFLSKVVSTWNSLKATQFDTLPQFIAQVSQNLDQTQQNNFQRWPILGETVWPNPQAAGSYRGEVAYFSDWLTTRIGWLDSQFNSKASSTISLTTPQRPVFSGESATLTAVVASGDGGTPTGSVAFAVGPLLVGVAPLQESGLARFTTSALPLGTISIRAFYIGDARYAFATSATATMNVEPAAIPTITLLSAPSLSFSQGSSATFAAIVYAPSGNVQPTGSVMFSSDRQVMCVVPVGTDGTASCAVTNLPSGRNIVRASYFGGPSFLRSYSSMAVEIVPACGRFNMSCRIGVRGFQ